MSRRFSNTVIDPLFRRLNNSLFPDKALFSGAAVVAVQSLCRPCSEKSCRFPALLSSWLGRHNSSGRFLLSSVISGFPLSPQQLFFQAASPCGAKQPFTVFKSLFLPPVSCLSLIPCLQSSSKQPHGSRVFYVTQLVANRKPFFFVCFVLFLAGGIVGKVKQIDAPLKSANLPVGS